MKGVLKNLTGQTRKCTRRKKISATEGKIKLKGEADICSTAMSDAESLKSSVFITPCRELDQSSSLKILAQSEKYRPNFHSKKTLGCGSTRVRHKATGTEQYSSQSNTSQMDCNEVSSQSVSTAIANRDAEGNNMLKKSDLDGTKTTSKLTTHCPKIVEDDREFLACTRAQSVTESQCSERSCTEITRILLSEHAASVMEPPLIHHSIESHYACKTVKTVGTDEVEHGVGSDERNYKSLPETCDISLTSYGSEYKQDTSYSGQAVETMMPFDDFIDISDSQLCTLDDLTRAQPIVPILPCKRLPVYTKSAVDLEKRQQEGRKLVGSLIADLSAINSSLIRLKHDIDTIKRQRQQLFV